MLSITEENYLKNILYLNLGEEKVVGVGTNELAGALNVKPSSVNDMLKKLRSKSFIDFEKYGKIFLTEKGKRRAIEIIRKHRLWETFLYEKLDFTWDEVHEIAEQLEHIQSEKLVEKLDKFLGFPKTDPHGDPIPNKEGEFSFIPKLTLDQVPLGNTCKMIAVKDNSAVFLNYVIEIGLGINNSIKVCSMQEFDGSLEIEVDGKRSQVSNKFATNIFVV
jgi:DtxR family Mn-dependent transcriptional regulator